jgi:hypothetical protein
MNKWNCRKQTQEYCRKQTEWLVDQEYVRTKPVPEVPVRTAVSQYPLLFGEWFTRLLLILWNNHNPVYEWVALLWYIFSCARYIVLHMQLSPWQRYVHLCLANTLRQLWYMTCLFLWNNHNPVCEWVALLWYIFSCAVCWSIHSVTYAAWPLAAVCSSLFSKHSPATVVQDMIAWTYAVWVCGFPLSMMISSLRDTIYHLEAIRPN